jgi:competence protein ComEA
MLKKTSVLLIVMLAGWSMAALAADATPSGVVNVNNADAEQLQLLPRIGPALADRIIEFREANGPFASVDELIAVKGIGERSLERLEPFVTTKGATTLNAKVRSPRSKTDGADAH